MTLAPGAQVGSFEILDALGAGGMGEVYRARDLRLGREVALKVLPGARVVSEEARRRFEQEARTISQLNHPHICALHDLGRDGDVDFLVLELLNGETLADRLLRGALPLPQLFRIGEEICSALEAAHRKGVVHRDLKPGNVMLTESGVKVLDFGLAKSFAGASTGTPLTELPTEAASPRTTPGIVVGTLPYMAPEQLEGRPCDARTDIFALGAVLYEMATGRRAFSGQTHATLISAILTSDPPPVSREQRLSPPELDALVKTCLAKEPEERWQSARDVALQLRAASVAPLSRAAPSPPRGRLSRWLPWLVAAASLIALAVALIRRPARPAAGPIRFTVPPPPGEAFFYNNETTLLAFSPDGSKLAFVAGNAEAGRHVYLRPLDSPEAKRLPGTEGATFVCFSPGGDEIAFLTPGKLRRLSLAGGAPVPVCDVPIGAFTSASWGARDILFAGPHRDAIYRVPATGGTPVKAISIDSSRDRRLAHPWFLPDGERFLYLLRRQDQTSDLMLSEPGKPPRPLTALDSSAQYVDPGVLVFAREGALLGQRFDWRRGRLEGAPFSIAERVRYFLSTGAVVLATARSGALAYQTRHELRRLIWFDRSGEELGGVGTAASYFSLSLGRDGKRALVDRRREDIGTFDVWSLDLALGTETRLTAGRDTEAFPISLPGGDILYSVVGDAYPRLVRRSLSSGEEGMLIPARHAFQIAQDVSADGRELVFTERKGGTFDVIRLPLSGSGEATPLLQSPYDETSVRFSPDGRYLALISTESGRQEAYVMPFAGPGERRRISSHGAVLVRWSPGGKELLYLAPDGRLMAMPVSTHPALELGAPAPLFRLTSRVWSTFEVAPDGRLLALVPEVVADELPLEVVVGWTPPAGS